MIVWEVSLFQFWLDLVFNWKSKRLCIFTDAEWTKIHVFWEIKNQLMFCVHAATAQTRLGLGFGYSPMYKKHTFACTFLAKLYKWVDSSEPWPLAYAIKTKIYRVSVRTPARAREQRLFRFRVLWNAPYLKKFPTFRFFVLTAFARKEGLDESAHRRLPAFFVYDKLLKFVM